MKRYVICSVLDGPAFGEERFIRPKLYDMGVDHVAVIRFTAGGDPFPVCLALVSAADLSAVLADADVDALPDVSLDLLWSSLPSATRTAIRTRLLARGFTVTGIVAGLTVRQVLRYLGQQLRAEFDENKFDVSG